MTNNVRLPLAEDWTVHKYGSWQLQRLVTQAAA